MTNRARRFSLPDLADERVDEAITSFIAGPEQRRGRRSAAAAEAKATGATSVASPFVALHTRIAWTEALHRERARSLRYRRPASVVVVAGEATTRSVDADHWLQRVAGPMAHVIQRGLRETDLVTRTGEARFQVLLPETAGNEASNVADRIVLDCQVWLQALHAPIRVRAAAAGTTPETTLDVALDRALGSIEPARTG